MNWNFLFSYPFLVLHKKKKNEKKFSFFKKNKIILCDLAFCLLHQSKKESLSLYKVQIFQAKSNPFSIFLCFFTPLPFAGRQFFFFFFCFWVEFDVYCLCCWSISEFYNVGICLYISIDRVQSIIMQLTIQTLVV